MTIADKSIADIWRLLPHRYPFLLIDRILSYNAEEATLTALKNISINEPIFNGHFPDEPIFPGVLQVEAMAQSCGLLWRKSSPKNQEKNSPVLLLAGIEKSRFRQLVQPGDQLLITVRRTAAKGLLIKFSCHCSVDGKKSAEADLLLAFQKL